MFFVEKFLHKKYIFIVMNILKTDIVSAVTHSVFCNARMHLSILQ